jgi:hypothetical protein
MGLKDCLVKARALFDSQYRPTPTNRHPQKRERMAMGSFTVRYLAHQHSPCLRDALLPWQENLALQRMLTAQPEALRKPRCGGIEALCFLEDERGALPPDYLAGGDTAGRLRVWDTRLRHDKANSEVRVWGAHGKPVFCLSNARTRGGAHGLVSGAEDGGIALWDVPSAEAVRRLEAHTSFVAALAASADQIICSSGLDGLFLWDQRERDPVFCFAAERYITDVHFLDDTSFLLLATVAKSSTVLLDLRMHPTHSSSVLGAPTRRGDTSSALDALPRDFSEIARLKYEAVPPRLCRSEVKSVFDPLRGVFCRKFAGLSHATSHSLPLPGGTLALTKSEREINVWDLRGEGRHTLVPDADLSTGAALLDLASPPVLLCGGRVVASLLSSSELAFWSLNPASLPLENHDHVHSPLITLGTGAALNSFTTIASSLHSPLLAFGSLTGEVRILAAGDASETLGVLEL